MLMVTPSFDSSHLPRQSNIRSDKLTTLQCVLYGGFFKQTVRVREWSQFFFHIEMLKAGELGARYKITRYDFCR